MNNSPINSTINSTMVVELADASSLRYYTVSVVKSTHISCGHLTPYNVTGSTI